MQSGNNIQKVAQSASAIGAAILGFGVGAKWGSIFTNSILMIAIVVGGVLHLAGMYLVQMRDFDKNAAITAKILWISAWICLLILLALFTVVMWL